MDDIEKQAREIARSRCSEQVRCWILYAGLCEGCTAQAQAIADLVRKDREKGREDLCQAHAAHNPEGDCFLCDLEELREVRSLEDYHEDHGSVLWWRLPIEEPPYCGDPSCSDWPFKDDDKLVWTPLRALAIHVEQASR